MYLQGEWKGSQDFLWMRTSLASDDAAVFSEVEAATEVNLNCVLSCASEATGLNKNLKTLKIKK